MGLVGFTKRKAITSVRVVSFGFCQRMVEVGAGGCWRRFLHSSNAERRHHPCVRPCCIPSGNLTSDRGPGPADFME
jgi:hypothetical protein